MKINAKITALIFGLLMVTFSSCEKNDEFAMPESAPNFQIHKKLNDAGNASSTRDSAQLVGVIQNNRKL